MRENAIWKFVDKVTGQAPGGCTIPGGSQTFESSFESDGGNYTVKYAIDDNLTLNLVEQRTGKTIKTISSGNNQGGSATVAAFKIPAGTCLVKGTVSNNANWSIDPAGVVIEIFNSGGGTAWSTSSLL